MYIYPFSFKYSTLEKCDFELYHEIRYCEKRRSRVELWRVIWRDAGTLHCVYFNSLSSVIDFIKTNFSEQ